VVGTVIENSVISSLKKPTKKHNKNKKGPNTQQNLKK